MTRFSTILVLGPSHSRCRKGLRPAMNHLLDPDHRTSPSISPSATRSLLVDSDAPVRPVQRSTGVLLPSLCRGEHRGRRAGGYVSSPGSSRAAGVLTRIDRGPFLRRTAQLIEAKASRSSSAWRRSACSLGPASSSIKGTDVRVSASCVTGAFLTSRSRRGARLPLSSVPKVVPGGPTEILVCRYSGLGAKPSSPGAFRLISHHLITDTAVVRPIAQELNHLKPAGGPTACPADNDTAIIAFFRYRNASTNPVTVGLSGCRLVTNGHRAHDATASVIDQLRG
jgi:hypothetical protein